jgi:hypothetical protein
MNEVIRSSKTPILTTETRHKIPEGGILDSDRQEYLKSYVALTG